MKTSTQKKLLAAALLVLACTTTSQAQMTGTVVTQPCNNNGHIAVTATGLTPPITYVYSNWMASQSFTHSNVNSITDNLTGIAAYQSTWGNANNWIVSATDGSNTDTISKTLVPAFTFTVSQTVAACPLLNSVQASFTGGTSPFTCVWTNTLNNLTYLTNPASLPNGHYRLVATDFAGCMLTSITSSGNINVLSQSSVTITTTGTSANCSNGTAFALASGGVGPYTYLWSNNSVSQSLTGLTQGYYSCVATDALGCQGPGGYFVTQAVIITFNSTVNNATCLQNNGAITSFVNGGTAPYTFLWSNAATTQNVSGLTGGQYICQITDANGCTKTGYSYVGVSTPIAMSYISSPSSCNSPTGGATVTATGGTAPYTIVWYTSPSNTSGTSITNKPSGMYSFKVTDNVGCVQTGSAYIPPASSLYASVGGAIVCPATTGIVGVGVSGSNPPFTYAWSTSATTSTINAVYPSVYTCTVTDNLGCKKIANGGLHGVNQINIGLNATMATCKYLANGAITANASGGLAPYSYVWSNTQTGATATGLLPGWYYVNVTDANGCQWGEGGYVGNSGTNNSCYCTITGTVYADANSNCVRNIGENGIPNVQIHCSPYGYAYTNSNGVYSFQVPTGTYTLSESIQQIYPLASCQTNNQVASVTAAANCATTVDFANNIVVLSDLHIINTNWNWPVPGNIHSQLVIVQNEGTTTESSIKMGYTHDGQLSFNNSNAWTFSQLNSTTYPNWYSINSGFPSLGPGSSTSSFLSYNVPANIPLNTVIQFKDTAAKSAPIATSWLTDNSPWNNVDQHQAYVVGSYDPNFKEVTPQGKGPTGDITNNDSTLTYVIHFQNTGTYFAQNVILVDTIDSNLRLSTLRPGYSDHKYSVEISESGVVKFTFANINLPYKEYYGDVLSSGMVVYSVKLKKNLAIGTQIKNKAAIYFDYNEPVITNTTLNTITKPTTTISVTEHRMVNSNEALLFPNPANNFFTLLVASAENTKGLLSVFDISGREVSSKPVELQSGENGLTESTTHLQSGIYFVQLKTENTVIAKKLVIAK